MMLSLGHGRSKLWQYDQKGPRAYDKTTEEKIAQHSKELKKKCRRDIKIKRRQPEAVNAFGISFANSNISKAMSSSTPKKLQVGTSRSRKLSATPNTSNALSIAASSAASSTVTPTTSKSKRTRKAPDYFGFESSVYLVSDPEPMTAPKSQKQINPVIETVIHEEALQPSAIDTSCELTVVIILSHLLLKSIFHSHRVISEIHLFAISPVLIVNS